MTALPVENVVFQNNEKYVTLNDFLRFIKNKMNNGNVKLTAEYGRKYIRIVIEQYSSRSVYCFLDYAGNIYKAASWKAPAKHVRGTVFMPDYGWGKALGPYGAAYLR